MGSLCSVSSPRSFARCFCTFQIVWCRLRSARLPNDRTQDQECKCGSAGAASRRCTGLLTGRSGSAHSPTRGSKALTVGPAWVSRLLHLGSPSRTRHSFRSAAHLLFPFPRIQGRSVPQSQVYPSQQHRPVSALMTFVPLNTPRVRFSLQSVSIQNVPWDHLVINEVARVTFAAHIGCSPPERPHGMQCRLHCPYCDAAPPAGTGTLP